MDECPRPQTGNGLAIHWFPTSGRDPGIHRPFRFRTSSDQNPFGSHCEQGGAVGAICQLVPSQQTCGLGRSKHQIMPEVRINAVVREPLDQRISPGK